MVLEVNDAGEVLLPAELVQAAPHTRLEAGRHGDALVLKPVTGATPRPPKHIGRVADVLGRAGRSQRDLPPRRGLASIA